MADEVAKETNLLAAKIKARQAMKTVAKTGFNSFDKYDYSTLADYLTAIEGPLADNGLDIVQEVTEVEHFVSSSKTMPNGYRVKVETTLTHASTGDSIHHGTPGEAFDKGDKALWKAITGARKFALQLLFNLYGEDDPEQDSAPDAERAPTTSHARSTSQTSTTAGRSRGEDGDPQARLPLEGPAADLRTTDSPQRDPMDFSIWQVAIDGATIPDTLIQLLDRARSYPTVWADRYHRRRIFDACQVRNESGISNKNLTGWSDETSINLEKVLAAYLKDITEERTDAPSDGN